jgi:hypothetical protein
VSSSQWVSASTSRLEFTLPNSVLSPIYVTNSDQTFGIVIIALLFFQAGLGYYHHHRFILDKPSHRRWFTHAHLWLGRIVIICGLANCGCGLRLVPVEWKYVVIWWIVSGVLVIIYAAASLVLMMGRRSKPMTGEPFGNAAGPGFNPQRYATAESYSNGYPVAPSYELRNRV